MPLLCDFPSPPVARESFAGGFSDKGTALLTLDELEMYSSGKGARTERLYKCPFCGASERAFHLNIDTGAFNCKRSSCGVKGQLREFWPARVHLTSSRFQTKRKRKSAFALSPEPAFIPSPCGNWRALWEAAFTLDEPQAQPGRDYVIGRGVSIEAATGAGVRFCRNWAPSTEGKTYNGGAAVLFPLLDRSGELVAASGRYLRLQPNGPKARTGGDASHGAFRVAARSVDPLDCEQPVLVEGPFDALALATCGVPALAMNGASLPVWLARAMAFKAPFLCPDGDGGGAAALAAWRRDIGPFAPHLGVLRPDGFKDFGEALECFGRDWLTAWLRENAGQLLEPRAFVDEAPAPFVDESTRPNTFVDEPARDVAAIRARSASYWQSRDVVASTKKAAPAIRRVPLAISGADLVRAARRLERDFPKLAASMNAEQMLQHAVVIACLNRGLDVPLEWETESDAAAEVQPMNEPKRICIKRGQAFPDKNTKLVKRPTKWGNPFPAGIDKNDLPEVQLEKRRVAVEKFVEWIETAPEGQAIAHAAARELRGWNLACACPIDGGPCHGDVLLKLANANEVN